MIVYYIARELIQVSRYLFSLSDPTANTTLWVKLFTNLYPVNIWNTPQMSKQLHYIISYNYIESNTVSLMDDIKYIYIYLNDQSHGKWGLKLMCYGDVLTIILTTKLTARY